MNIHAGIDEFLLNCEIEGMSKHTLTWYQSLLGRFAESIGQVQLAEITPHDIRQYLAAVRKTYISESTISAHTRSLHRFWKWATAEYNITNPMRNIKYPAQPQPTPKAAAIEDIMAMFKIAGVRDRAIIAWLLDTGCRAQGAVTVRIGDIDFASRKAVVTEKGNKTRMVVFTSATETILKEWIVQRGELGITILFYSHDTLQPLTPNGLYQALRRLARRAGVNGRFNAHSFRHAFAREYIKAGGDLATLAQLLGHRDVSTTVSHYAIFTDNEIAQKHEQFSPMNWLLGDETRGESG